MKYKLVPLRGLQSRQAASARLSFEPVLKPRDLQLQQLNIDDDFSLAKRIKVAKIDLRRSVNIMVETNQPDVGQLK